MAKLDGNMAGSINQTEDYVPLTEALLPVHTVEGESSILVEGLQGTKNIRRQMCISFAKFALLSGATAVALTAIYLGALWDPYGRLSKQKALIVNLDEGYYGGFIMAKIVEKSNVTMSWETNARLQLDEVKSLVAANKYWVALVIPADYSFQLTSAAQGLISYFNTTIKYVYCTGKHFTTSSLQYRVISQMLWTANGEMAQRFNDDEDFYDSKKAVSLARYRPFNYEDVNLAPVTKYGMYFSTYIPLVCLWIATMASVTLGQFTFRDSPDGKMRLSFTRWTLLRILALSMVSLFNALAVAILLRLLGLQMNSGFGPVFWTLFLGTLSFQGLQCVLHGIAGEGMLILSVYFLIFMLCGSDGIFSTELQPAGFGVGGAMLPFYHAVKMLRYLCFGGENYVARSVVVLLSYWVGGSGLAAVGWYYDLGRKVLQLVLPQTLVGMRMFTVL